MVVFQEQKRERGGFKVTEKDLNEDKKEEEERKKEQKKLI